LDLIGDFLSLDATLPAGGPWYRIRSLRHAGLQSNIAGELYVALRDGDCRVFTSDMRVRVSNARMYAYPDVSVVCGRPILVDDHQDNLLNPIVIFEVLSPAPRDTIAV
jgi:Uma2 family endonuclease